MYRVMELALLEPGDKFLFKVLFFVFKLQTKLFSCSFKQSLILYLKVNQKFNDNMVIQQNMEMNSKCETTAVM